MIKNPPDPDALREAMKAAARLEKEWRGKIPDNDKSRCPWMPFPMSAYILLLDEAFLAAPGNRFLDVGAGVGSKMLRARDTYGLDITGIEIVPEYAAEAGRAGLDVRLGDALDFRDYGDYDLIWLYRPFRDPGLQADLERIIWDQMAPGAIVMCAGLEAPPPSPQFWPELDDLELKRGIYRKLPGR
jgi:SAM-dependent methyltransferase